MEFYDALEKCEDGEYIYRKTLPSYTFKVISGTNFFTLPIPHDWKLENDWEYTTKGDK